MSSANVQLGFWRKYNHFIDYSSWFRLLSTSSYDVSDEVDVEVTEQDIRVKTLNQSDPVYTMKLKDAVFSQLNQLKLHLGDENFERLLNSADSEIVQQLQSFSS